MFQNMTTIQKVETQYDIIQILINNFKNTIVVLTTFSSEKISVITYDIEQFKILNEFEIEGANIKAKSIVQNQTGFKFALPYRDR